MTDKIERPEPPKTAMAAFYHLFTVEQFEWETDAEFEERQIVREQFRNQLEENGMTAEQFYGMITAFDKPPERKLQLVKPLQLTEKSLITKLIDHI